MVSLLLHWQSLGEDGAMPRLLKFDPTRIPTMWPHCFLATLSSQDNDFTFDYIGSGLAAYSQETGSWKRGSEVPDDSFLALPLRAIPVVREESLPTLVTGQAAIGEGEVRKFRAIVLPLADHRDHLAYYLGAASGKSAVASPEECVTSWEIATLQNGRWTSRETYTGDD